MKKVIRNGKVAVLISPPFGAGWYSDNLEHEELLFHPKLIEMVEKNEHRKITSEWLKEKLNIDIYCGGAGGLVVKWVTKGTKFIVQEYDGAEGIVYLDDLPIIEA